MIAATTETILKPKIMFSLFLNIISNNNVITAAPEIIRRGIMCWNSFK
jgi:hypothetical protein